MTTTASLKDLPEPWRRKPVFETGGRTFTFCEVIQSAALRTDLPPLIDAARARQACEWRAGAAGLEPDLDAIGAAVDEFRYARNLESAEDTEQWLEQRGLGTDDLVGYCTREYWSRLPGAAQGGGVPTAPEDAVETWPADLVFTGDFLRLARELAAEASLGLGAAPAGEGKTNELLDRLAARLALDRAGLDAWLAGWELDAGAAATFFHWQELTAEWRREALDPGERSRVLAEQRPALAQVEVAIVRFDTETAAKEAYLCVRSDHLELEAVAEEAGYPVDRRIVFLRDLPEALRTPVLGARGGTTLPPQSIDGSFDVCRVIRHLEPALGDPAVAAAVDATLIRRRFGAAGLSPVRWHLQEEVAA